MAIDFSQAACIEVTDEQIFGICDDPHPAKNPAYLDFVDDDKWNVWVDNNLKKQVTFTAVDHCINIQPAHAERCDGMLHYDTTLIFVEIKDRDSGRWLGKARDQLESTINIYKAEVGLNNFNRFYGHVANRQKPYFNAANPVLAQQFEDDTGFVLIVDHFIEIN